MSVRFSNQLVAELYQPFWAVWQAGEFLTDAAAVAATYRHRGLAWLRRAGGGASASGTGPGSVVARLASYADPVAARCCPSGRIVGGAYWRCQTLPGA